MSDSTTTVTVDITEQFEYKSAHLTSVDPEEVSDEELKSRAREIALTNLREYKDRLRSNMEIEVNRTASDSSDHRLELTQSGDGIGVTEYDPNTGAVVEEWWYTWSELSEQLTGKQIPPDIV